MAEELAREPTALEVYLRSHEKKKDKFLCDNKAKNVMEEFNWLKSDNELAVPENDLLLEALGGWTQRGRIYGLGSAGKTFYEKPSSQPKKSVKSLEAEVVELRAQLEIRDTREANMMNMIEQLQTNMNVMEHRMGGCNPLSFRQTFQSPPPPLPPSTS